MPRIRSRACRSAARLKPSPSGSASPTSVSSTPAAAAPGANRATVSSTMRRASSHSGRRPAAPSRSRSSASSSSTRRSNRAASSAIAPAARAASSPAAVPSASAEANPPMTVSGVRRSCRRSARRRVSPSRVSASSAAIALNRSVSSRTSVGPSRGNGVGSDVRRSAVAAARRRSGPVTDRLRSVGDRDPDEPDEDDHDGQGPDEIAQSVAGRRVELGQDDRPRSDAVRSAEGGGGVEVVATVAEPDGSAGDGAPRGGRVEADRLDRTAAPAEVDHGAGRRDQVDAEPVVGDLGCEGRPGSLAGRPGRRRCGAGRRAAGSSGSGPRSWRRRGGAEDHEHRGARRDEGDQGDRGEGQADPCAQALEHLDQPATGVSGRGSRPGGTSR